MPDDPLASALEEIRERAAHAEHVLVAGGSFGHAAARSQADVPRLLAALDAVLELTGPSGEIHNDLDGNEEHGLIRVVRCDVLRQAITSALGTVGDSSSEEGGG